MDYDILDGASRPRLQMQPGGQRSDQEARTSFSVVHAGICASVGIGLVGLGLGLLAGVWQFVALWLGVSLVLGPIAPPSITGGDCRVGVGEPVLPEEDADKSVEQFGGQGGRGQHYSRSRERHAPRQAVEVVNGLGLAEHRNGVKSSSKGSSQKGRSDPVEEYEEKEWSLEDVELMKKLMVKHPRGTLRRWEVIAEGLGGKHHVDSVVKMSKAVGQKKVGGGDRDAYSKFLSQRKVADVAIASPLSRRDDDIGGEAPVVLAADPDEPVSAAGGGNGNWTEGEDKALLTALKTFPKDTPMRWDKVALALPGRSKAQCFRRFSDLRKSFRSSIGGGSAGQEDLTKD